MDGMKQSLKAGVIDGFAKSAPYEFRAIVQGRLLA